MRQATLIPTPEETFSDSLVFQYEVQEGDADQEGVGVSANALMLNGGGVNDSAGNDAGLSHDALPASPDHRVETTPD